MPLSIQQLESRKDKAMDKIEENRKKINDMVAEFRLVPFKDPKDFFDHLFESKNSAKHFLR